MKRSVKTSEIKGTLTAPSSKSMTQRAIGAATLSEGTTKLFNASDCNDARSAISMAKALGAEVQYEEDSLIIHGNKSKIKKSVLNCGESGLGVRMFSPIAALLSEETLVNGEGSLLSRPINMIEQALIQLGLYCKTNNGLLPMTIKGTMRGGDIKIDGSISSQLLTGLLMALPKAPFDSTIHVNNLKSRAYIDMTLELLNQFGINIENLNYENFLIRGNQKYIPCRYKVEGDWSAGAILLVAGAIGGEIEVKGLRTDSRQADKAILKALAMAGAQIKAEETSIRVSSSNLSSFSFDASDCPDLFPPLVSLATYCCGVSEIEGVERLIYKESNRALALQNEFKKMGITIEIENNIMKVHGEGRPT